MRRRLNLILLGVQDIARSSAFYLGLGWPQAPTSHARFCKIDLGGVVLGLISQQALADDCGQTTASNPAQTSHCALAYIARTPEEVAQTLKLAADLGGQI